MASLELTYHCNWSCVFCYNPRRFDRDRLSAKEWDPVLDDLRKLGTLTVTLTGGEPLRHPEFLTIARAVRARSMAVRIFTNASLIDDVMAAEIASLFPQSVEVSLHGATAVVHDRATQQAGSYEEMWRGVDRLRKRGVRIVVKSPLTSINEDHLEDMVALVREKGLPFRVDPNLTSRDGGVSGQPDHAPSRGAVARLMRIPDVAGSLPPIQRDPMGANCGVARITLAIDPDGNVFPCTQWRHTSLGNVRKNRLAEIWESSPERARVAQVAVDANRRLISEGGPVAAFSFCPALAYKHTGDVSVSDDSFMTQATIADAIRQELAS